MIPFSHIEMREKMSEKKKQVQQRYFKSQNTIEDFENGVEAHFDEHGYKIELVKGRHKLSYRCHSKLNHSLRTSFYGDVYEHMGHNYFSIAVETPKILNYFVVGSVIAFTVILPIATMGEGSQMYEWLIRGATFFGGLIPAAIMWVIQAIRYQKFLEEFSHFLYDVEKISKKDYKKIEGFYNQLIELQDSEAELT